MLATLSKLLPTLQTLSTNRQKLNYRSYYNNPTRPDAYPSEKNDDPQETYSYVRRLLKLQQINYYHALLHPYAVCVNRSPVSLPMEIPIPTITTYNLRRFDLTADTSGVLKLRFQVPKRYAPGIYQPGQAYYTYGAATSAINWTRFANPPTLVNAIKARNIGTEFRITYVGKVLDTAGTIESMASYTSSANLYSNGVIPFGASLTEFTTNPDIDSYGHQMPWFQRDPVEPGKIVRCIWAPSDYTDRDFQTNYSVSTTALLEESSSDMEWFVLIKGVQPNAPFLIEIANIIEQQFISQQDVYARNSSILTEKHIDSKAIVEEGLSNRSSSYHTSVSDSLKTLASKGIDYLKTHGADIAGWGLKTLATLIM